MTSKLWYTCPKLAGFQDGCADRRSVNKPKQRKPETALHHLQVDAYNLGYQAGFNGQSYPSVVSMVRNDGGDR